MSQRHRSQDVAPPPKMDLRAHAHNERHRINSELHSLATQVSAGYEPGLNFWGPLEGEHIAEEFQAIVENYVRARYGAPDPQSSAVAAGG